MQQVSHSFSEKIVIGCQMTFTTKQKIAYGAGLAATILAGAGVGVLGTASALAITSGVALGATVGLIGIIFHRTVIAGQAEQKLNEIKNATTHRLSSSYSDTKALAHQGYRDAAFYAGQLAGKFTDPNHENIFNHYKNAADKGHIRAQIEVGNRYRHGVGVGADTPLAMKYYKLAANQGDSVSMCNVGDIYRDIDLNYTEALKWYQLAAKNKSGTAFLRLADVYYEGKWGQNVDYQKAAEYYEKANKNAIVSQDLFLRLIKMYENGVEGVEKNKEKAEEYSKEYDQHFSKK